MKMQRPALRATDAVPRGGHCCRVSEEGDAHQWPSPVPRGPEGPVCRLREAATGKQRTEEQGQPTNQRPLLRTSAEASVELGHWRRCGSLKGKDQVRTRWLTGLWVAWGRQRRCWTRRLQASFRQRTEQDTPGAGQEGGREISAPIKALGANSIKHVQKSKISSSKTRKRRDTPSLAL